ncbi:hypothetical protein MRB53_014605 [Persea americana]|uniref:Uncharacterized protein n=1 Tax=Persea americana TaxID=3435 RepID=A0ACC2KBS2_PERAE|nr:hypothetical protein MRB53_014605 [Persea americana]
MEGDEEKLETFLKWAANIGISDSPRPLQSSTQSPSSSCLGRSLSIAQFPDAGGRGLAAARDLRRGEVILRVPRAALLTRESVLEDQKLAVSVCKYPHLSSTQVLTVCLLAEVGKGRGSRWHPYLMQLPRTYDTLANFNLFEIQALQVDDAIWASEKAISKHQSDWKEALILMQEVGLKPQLLTFRSWLWASATISSRTLHTPWDDAGCLCPVGDFFNYAAPEEESFCSEDEMHMVGVSSNCSSLRAEINTEKSNDEQLDCNSQRLTDGGYEEDIAAYCFYARRNYKKGEQVLLCYGSYSNLELLEHYGFLLKSNPSDRAFIQLDMSIRSSHSWPNDSLYIQQDGKPSFALLSALRLWATAPNLRREVGHLAYSGSLLSTENEVSVMKWLSKKCQGLLETLPTSMEEDGLLLDVIDKMQNHWSPAFGVQMLACEGELNDFFLANGLQKGDVAGFQLTTKAMRSMQRWRLAVEWRFRQENKSCNLVLY